tara:strand:- start:999 stop:1862 length:864 start_codon:yes stop_codon:yes gene_type:complete
MKKLYVNLAQAPKNTKELLSQKALENNDPIIDEDTVIIEETTGETLVIYKDNESEIDTTGMIDALAGVKFSVNKRTNGLVTQSEIIGYRPRMVGLAGKKTCSKTAFGNKYKSIEDELFHVAHIAEELYGKFAPERYQNHSELAANVRGEYLMPETHFTSGIINKNNPLKYHLDTGNFKNVFSIMLGLKKDVKGGYLHVPELQVNLKISNGSLSMFDGQRFVHGVTPMRGTSPSSYRFTIVFYSLVQMWNCLETSLEVANAKKAEDRKLEKLLHMIEEEKAKSANSNS